MRCDIRYVIFLLISLCLCLDVQGQAPKKQAGLDLKVDSLIYLEPGIHSIMVSLQNNLAVPFEGELGISLPLGLEMLGEVIRKLNLPSGKQTFLYFRFQTKSLSSLADQKIRLKLTDLTGKLWAQKDIALEIPEVREVKIVDETPFQTLQREGDSIRLKLRVSNLGSTDENLRILFSSPDRIGKTQFIEKHFYLRSGQDTLLQLGILSERYMLMRAQFVLRVNGLYDNNDVFDNLTLSFSNVASIRDYKELYAPSLRNYQHSPNYLEFQVDRLFAEQKTYQLRSEGKYPIAKGMLQYQALLTKLEGYEVPFLHNTQIQYERLGTSLALGNIQESLDQSLHGRGLRLTRKNEVKDIQYTIGGMQRSSDLIGYYDRKDQGYSFFSKLQLGNESFDRKAYEGQVIYDRNLLDSVSSLLWSNSFEILAKKHKDRIQLHGFVGSGMQQSLRGKYAKQNVAASLAVGLKMERNWNKLSLFSENFYSSAYYPGNRKGTLQSIHRLKRNWGKYSGMLGLTYLRYAPAYFSLYPFTFHTELSRLEASYFIPLQKFGTLGISPSYSRERNSLWAVWQKQYFKSNSWRILTNWNMRSPNLKHYFNVILESAYLDNNLQEKKYVAFKSDVSYSYRAFALHSSYQYGLLNATDLMNTYTPSFLLKGRFALGLRYDDQLLNNRLAIASSLMLHKQEANTKLYTGMFQMRYKLLRQTELMASLIMNYSQYPQRNSYFYQNARMGVRQMFHYETQQKAKVKTGDLYVQCFLDKNNNERFDAGDELVAGYQFTVKGVLLFTDKQGRALFKNLPYGEYELFFARRLHYLSNAQSIQMNSKRKEVLIPLQLGGTVKGKVTLEYRPGISLETDLNLDRFVLIAENSLGKQFKIPCDVTGGFEQSLPVGQYRVYLDEQMLNPQESFDGPQRTMELLAGKTLELEEFVVKVKSRELQIKRFGL